MTPPATLLPYLATQGSLTAMLEAKAGQILRVKVIKEEWQPIDFKNKKILNLPVHRPALAWVREVLLFGNDEQAWIHAKSIFPQPSLIGNAKRLRHLKDTPIGYVMFKKSRTLPCQRHIFKHDGQFKRASIYDWQGRYILVEEIFLHGFITSFEKF